MGRVHGGTWPCTRPVSGYVTAVYTHVRVYVQVYTCTWRIHGRVHAMYTAVTRPCIVTKAVENMQLIIVISYKMILKRT